MDQDLDLIDRLPTGAVIVKDTDGTPGGLLLERTNEFAKRAFPKAGRDDGRHFRDIPEYLEVGDMYLEAIRTGKAVSVGIVEDRDGDGWYVLEAGPFGQDRALVVFHNVTALQLESIAHQQAHAQALAMNEKFMRALAHDLKEPARTVSQFTELLATHWEKMSEDKRTDFLERAHKGAMKLTEMIDRLRSLILELNGNGSVPCHPLRKVVDDAVHSVQGSLEETGADLTLDVDVEDGYVVSASVSNVIQNLLDNSIKYSPERPVVRLSVHVEDGEAFVEVADRGMGFDPKDSETMFELFRRLYPQNKTPGLGMGLALCREIIERKGGQMLAHSEGAGKGATVAFRVPVRKVGDDQDTARGG